MSSDSSPSPASRGETCGRHISQPLDQGSPTPTTPAAAPPQVFFPHTSPHLRSSDAHTRRARCTDPWWQHQVHLTCPMRTRRQPETSTIERSRLSLLPPVQGLPVTEGCTGVARTSCMPSTTYFRSLTSMVSMTKGQSCTQ